MRGKEPEADTMMKRNLIAVMLAVALAVALLPAPVMAGLTVDPPSPGFLKITEMDGNVTYNFTITESLIPKGRTITIDVSSLDQFVGDGFSFVTNDNVVIEDSAADAVWTRNIDSSILTLRSTKNDTVPGQMVNVTFTGANGNPWIYDALIDDPDSIPLKAKRADTKEQAFFDLRFNITAGNLSIVSGAPITATDGATWANISIKDAPIIKDGTITLPVSLLNPYVASGTFTTDNIVVYDTVDDPTVWTGTVSGGTLTLMSTGGRTPAGNWVNVSFTGATNPLTGVANPWKPGTRGEKSVSLTAVRTDSGEPSDPFFRFRINIPPPAGYDVAADFTASPRSDIAQLTVAFTDASTGNPNMWNWSFGDGEWDNRTIYAERNPTHTYANVGTYTVKLNASNIYGADIRSRNEYINVLNGTIVTANTSINGLTITPGSPQSVTVDTTKLPAVLIPPDNSVLEILHAGNGWKNITIYAMPSTFFYDDSDKTITGPVTGVRLVSEEIAPSTPPFSLTTGPKSSFNYSIDLATYPPDAKLTTKIWEGVIEEYDNKFRQVIHGTGSGGSPGTAYTARVTKTNFPSGTAVKIHMSVNSSWIGSLHGDLGLPYIVRLSDDLSEGQILYTDWLYNDPAEKLDYYKADSPQGLSTFGLYSITGPNNVMQLIGLTVAQAASPPSEPSTSESNTGPITSATGAKNLEESGVIGQAAPPADPGQTANIYANPDGVITQATTMQSTDGIATVNVDLGVVAKGADNNPLTSISIAAVSAEDVPDLTGSTVSYAGMTYNLQPDGATFSPAISISFTVPPGQAGQDFTIRSYDPVSSTWQELPTTYDPATGTVTAQVSHFCLFAVFTKMVPKAPAIAATPVVTPLVPTTLAPPSPTIATTFLGIVLTVINLLVTNPILVVGIAVLAVGIALMVWKQRRDRLYPKT